MPHQRSTRLRSHLCSPSQDLNSIAEHRCQGSIIRHLSWLNRVDSSPLHDGLDSSQVEEILVTGLRVLVHVNRICAWVKLAPHLNAKSDKQHIYPPAMRGQDDLPHIRSALARTDQLTVSSRPFFSCFHERGLHERPSPGM